MTSPIMKALSNQIEKKKVRYSDWLIYFHALNLISLLADHGTD